MQFDRFDICEAWLLYASEHHTGQGSRLYRVLSRLDAIGFRARQSLSADTLSENARAIYESLVARGA
jgi:hypothetical protein